MKKQTRMEYVSPMIVAYSLEVESAILNPSIDRKNVNVDGLSEIYSDGTEANDDHFINLY